jgi:hypothetical protein
MVFRWDLRSQVLHAFFMKKNRPVKACKMRRFYGELLEEPIILLDIIRISLSRVMKYQS